LLVALQLLLCFDFKLVDLHLVEESLSVPFICDICQKLLSEPLLLNFKILDYIVFLLPDLDLALQQDVFFISLVLVVSVILDFSANIV